MDKFLKITLIGGENINVNTYVINKDYNALILRVSEICKKRFDFEANELRVYWIDDDGDQIDIADKDDYDVFQLMWREKRRVYVESVKKYPKDKKLNIQNTNDGYLEKNNELTFNDKEEKKDKDDGNEKEKPKIYIRRNSYRDYLVFSDSE